MRDVYKKWEGFEKNLVRVLALAIVEEMEINPKLDPLLFKGKINVDLRVPQSVAEMFADFVPDANEELPDDMDLKGVLMITEELINTICSMIFVSYGIKHYLKESLTKGES